MIQLLYFEIEQRSCFGLIQIPSEMTKKGLQFDLIVVELISYYVLYSAWAPVATWSDVYVTGHIWVQVKNFTLQKIDS